MRQTNFSVMFFSGFIVLVSIAVVFLLLVATQSPSPEYLVDNATREVEESLRLVEDVDFKTFDVNDFEYGDDESASTSQDSVEIADIDSALQSISDEIESLKPVNDFVTITDEISY